MQLNSFFPAPPALPIPINPPSFKDLIILGGIVLTGMLMGIIPAFKAYRQSLVDGMTIRL